MPEPLVLPDAVRPLVEEARAAERASRWERARSAYERALRALPPRGHAAAASALLRWIARTHVEAGDTDAAADCLEAALAVAEASGDARAVASALNSRAGLLFARGELDLCEELFGRTRSMARETGDRELLAMTQQNLGSVASVRGDHRLALLRFEASLAAYRELGLEDRLPPLLNNMGRLRTDLEAWDGARACLDQAADLCERQADRRHRVVVELNRARLHLRRGADVEARVALDAAHAEATASGARFWLPEIYKSYGALYRHWGRLDVAENWLRRAERPASERQDLLLLADVARERAAIHRLRGDSHGTLLSLNRAHRLFERLRARRELADVDRRLAELEGDYLVIVREWGESIEAKDAYTQGHCSRVAAWACRLAEAAGLPAEDRPWFRMGALLHDVGKVEVPLSVLNKDGPLTDDERRIIQRHPVAGVELLEGIDFPWDVRPMIRHHHERWDGGGYPDGLAGEGIPLAARILTVADVWDALTTTRSYRPAFAPSEALDVMEGESGRVFDPELWALFRGRVLEAGTGAAPAPTSAAPGVFATA